MEDNKPDWLPEEAHMLTQPLTTDEGFLNEACIAELRAAIKSMPETYERLAGDPEWSRKGYTSAGEIVGLLSRWAIEQTRCVPPQLETVCKYVRACLSKDERFVSDGVWKNLNPTAYISLIEINKSLHEILMDLPEFVAWNDAETEGLTEWASLGALLHNVCISIRDDRRHFEAFNRDFDKSHSGFERPSAGATGWREIDEG